ncbi:MAG: hypothetical protein VX871_07765 [Pseudomonadota bacterium]|nr:hypothetical protein [Pseudomonadota bacterium]
MRIRHMFTGLVAGLMLVALAAGTGARAEDCMSWAEARNAGLIEKFNLKPASEIKTRVEERYRGKVVHFTICKQGQGLTYKLVVMQDGGKVEFVDEPAQ